MDLLQYSLWKSTILDFVVLSTLVWPGFAGIVGQVLRIRQIRTR